MPDGSESELGEVLCSFGCSPQRLDPGPLAIANREVAARQQSGSTAQKSPALLLQSTPEWRRASLSATAHIPAGYTYLAQLMGHDVGSSVSQSSVPRTGRGNAIGAVSALGTRRYNLIDNPLTLETVYGPGPLMLSHLYDPDTKLFRLTKGARLARYYRTSTDPLSADRRPIRALYDERNRDTLMMHELTVAWMQFHNRCARMLLDSHQPFTVYVIVRNHAVRIWHDIVRQDILPRFLHPEIASMQSTPPEWELDESTLLHGLFRAFHAMPLAAYNLGRNGNHNLRSLLKSGFDHSDAETSWSIDWPLFFGEKPGGPKSGLSASVAPELRTPGAPLVVIAMDRDSAGEAQPLRAGNPEIKAALASLPAPWPERLTPEQLAADFNAAFPNAPVMLDADVIRWGPLFQMMMIEAQLHGQKGGFGPLGSALLRGSINGSIDRVLLDPERSAAQNLPRPATMLELIKLVRQEG